MVLCVFLSFSSYQAARHAKRFLSFILRPLKDFPVVHEREKPSFRLISPAFSLTLVGRLPLLPGR